jgi:hypothetical protein
VLLAGLDDSVLPRFGPAGGYRERREGSAPVPDHFHDLAELAVCDLADRSQVLDGDVQVSGPDRGQTGVMRYFRIGPRDTIPQQLTAGHHMPVVVLPARGPAVGDRSEEVLHRILPRSSIGRIILTVASQLTIL